MTRAPSRRLLLATGVLTLALLAAAAYRYGIPHWGSAGGVNADSDAGDKREGRRHGSDGPVTVTAAAIKIADVPVTIDAVGTVQALNSVVIRTQVDGRLMTLAVSEGQDVHKGDVVAEIDPALYKAQYDQAVAKKAQDEAILANSRLDLVRYQKLASGNFATKQQYDTQKSLVAQQEAQIRADQGAIDNAKTTLDYATIRSPIDGRAGIRLVDVGNILHPSDLTGILVINQLKPIYVVFTVPQQSLPAIQKAEKAGVSRAQALAPDNATPIDTGDVAVIDNLIDQTTGTAKIKAAFPNANLALWPGQFVNVRLVVDTIKKAIVAPSVAIQRGPNGAFVYIVSDSDVATFKAVTIERQDENNAVIASGVEPGTKVVTSGFSRLSDGAKIRIVDASGAQADRSSPEKTEKSGGAEERQPHPEVQRADKAKTHRGGAEQNNPTQHR